MSSRHNRCNAPGGGLAFANELPLEWIQRAGGGVLALVNELPPEWTRRAGERGMLAGAWPTTSVALERSRQLSRTPQVVRSISRVRCYALAFLCFAGDLLPLRLRLRFVRRRCNGWLFWAAEAARRW